MPQGKFSRPPEPGAEGASKFNFYECLPSINSLRRSPPNFTPFRDISPPTPTYAGHIIIVSAKLREVVLKGLNRLTQGNALGCMGNYNK